MRNRKTVPFEIVEEAVTGEPEAINAILCHYRGYIKYCSVFFRDILTQASRQIRCTAYQSNFAIPV